MTPFGVYVHWPFCARVCPYCDFNVYRARDRDPAPLRDAIVADIARHAARLRPRRVDSVFLGGGTPSLLSGADIGRLIAAVDDAFGLNPGVEITLEANPEDAARFEDHAAAGVNRFSIGVQALRDDALRALGRAHDAEAGRHAVERALRTGRRVSLDLIYAREGQGEADWAAELQEAIALGAEHLSLYQLTIEPGTAFGRAARRGRIRTPGDELAAVLYERTQAICEAAGLPAYEISNHARDAGARSRHNEIYWTGGDWIGVGPGAHGRFTVEGVRMATKAEDDPARYMASAAPEETPLTAAEHAEELVLMGLRRVEGLDRRIVEALRARSLDEAALASFAAAGLLQAGADTVRLTPAGRLLADHIAATLAS